MNTPNKFLERNIIKPMLKRYKITITELKIFTIMTIY